MYTYLRIFSLLLLAMPSFMLPENQEKQKEKGFVINFDNVPVAQFIQSIGQLSGKNFIYNERELAFPITCKSESPASVKEMLALLSRILDVNGFQMVEYGNNIYIHPKSTQKAPAPLDTGSVYETRLINLNYLDPLKAQEIALQLSPLARIQVHEASRRLIVVDQPENIKRLLQLITTLDTPRELNTYKLYEPKKAALSMLIDFARKTLPGILGKSDFELAIAPSQKEILVIAPKHMITQIITVLQEFDQMGALPTPPKQTPPAEEEEEEEEQPTFHDKNIQRKILDFHIYRLRYQPGTVVLSALQKIAASMRSQSSSDKNLIQAIESTQLAENADMLLIAAPTAIFDQIKTLIAPLDEPNKQVFIEALVVDSSLADLMQFGIHGGAAMNLSKGTNWSDNPLAVGAGIFPSGSSMPSALATDVVSSSGIVQPAVSSTGGFDAAIIGRALTFRQQIFTSLGSMIKALQSETSIRITMSQSLMVENKEIGEFFSGDQSRVVTGTVAATAGSNVVERNYDIRNVGATLRITPTIHSSGMVALDIEQEISRSSGASEGDQALVPLTKTSRTKTKAYVPDGSFLVISGTAIEDNTSQHSTIPCIGGLPVLSKAVGGSDRQNTKRNLTLFIRTRIVQHPPEMDRVTQSYQKQVQGNESGLQSELIDFLTPQS